MIGALMIFLIVYFGAGFFWSAWGVTCWLLRKSHPFDKLDIIIVPVTFIVNWFIWPYMLWLILSHSTDGMPFEL